MRYALLSILLLSSFIASADLYDIPQSKAVMKKRYSLRNELSTELGYLPVGALSKYLAVGGSYSMAFGENHGWEVLNVLYTPELKTSLKKQLTTPVPDGYGVDPTQIATLTYLLTTNFVFSPLYTKSLLFNSSMVHSQLSFVGGGGMAGFNIGSVPTADVGLIQRFFLSKTTSIKFDFRYYMFFSSNETVKNNIALVAGYTWTFGD